MSFSALPQSAKYGLDPMHVGTACALDIPQAPHESSAPLRLRQQLSGPEWETLKPVIHRSYIAENKTFIETANVLSRDHHFRPTKKQFNSKITQWGLKKNIRKTERSALLRTLGPVETESLIDNTGRVHTKQKLERWKRELGDYNGSSSTPGAQEENTWMQDSFSHTAAPSPTFPRYHGHPGLQFDQSLFEISTAPCLRKPTRPCCDADQVTRSLDSVVEDPNPAPATLRPSSSGQSPRIIDSLLPGSEEKESVDNSVLVAPDICPADNFAHLNKNSSSECIAPTEAILSGSSEAIETDSGEPSIGLDTGKRKVWVREDEQYHHLPFAPWANVDVLGSPKLNRLFENLGLETSGISEDIEFLALPGSCIEPSMATACDWIAHEESNLLLGSWTMPHSPSENKFISGSDLRLVCKKNIADQWPKSAHGCQSKTTECGTPIGMKTRKVVLDPFRNGIERSPPQGSLHLSGTQIERYVNTYDSLDQGSEIEPMLKARRVPYPPFQERRDISGSCCCVSSPTLNQKERRPTPFNELYAFSSSVVRYSPRAQNPMTLVQVNENNQMEYNDKLERFQRAGFDESHPAVLKVLKFLAALYYRCSKFKETETLCRKVLSAGKRSHGTNIVETFKVQLYLIESISEQGRYLEAKEMQEKLHTSMPSSFQPYHPVFQGSLVVKIKILNWMQNYEEEEDICRQLVQTSLIQFGPRDPSTLYAMYSLACAMRSRKRYAESERLQRIVIQLNQDTLYQDHNHFCWSLVELSNVLHEQGQIDDAIKLHRLSFERAKAHLGEKHVTTMECSSLLGNALAHRGLLQESEELLQRNVGLLRDVLGEDDLRTARAICALGLTLLRMEKYCESSIWFVKAYETSLAVLGPNHKFTILSCELLGMCYESQGFHMEALVIYRELLDKIRATKGQDDSNMFSIQNRINYVLRIIAGGVEASG